MNDAEDEDKDAQEPKTAVERLRLLMPHLALMYEMAKTQYPDKKIELAFVALNADGSGRVAGIVENSAEFLPDLAEALGVKDEPGWMYGFKEERDAIRAAGAAKKNEPPK